MIKLIVLDIDGTLSNGSIYYSKKGEVFKAFNAQDGLAIGYWVRELKNEAIVISGRISPCVKTRLNDLGVYEIYEGIKNKKELLLKIMKDKKLKKNEVAAIGDDVNDLAMLKMLNFSFAPKNANYLVKEAVSYVAPFKGGKGAGRWMIEFILKYDDKWDNFIAKWS